MMPAHCVKRNAVKLRTARYKRPEFSSESFSRDIEVLLAGDVRVPVLADPDPPTLAPPAVKPPPEEEPAPE